MSICQFYRHSVFLHYTGRLWRHVLKIVCNVGELAPVYLCLMFFFKWIFFGVAAGNEKLWNWVPNAALNNWNWLVVNISSLRIVYTWNWCKKNITREERKVHCSSNLVDIGIWDTWWLLPGNINKFLVHI